MRGLFQDTVIYGLGGALSRSAALLVMPILTRSLGAVDYGVVALSGVAGMILGTVADLQISAAMGRHYHNESETEGRRVLVGTGFCVVAAMSLAIMVIALIGARPISGMLFGDSRYAQAIIILAIQVPFQVLQSYLLYVLRLAGRRSAYVASSAAASAGGALISLALVVYTGLGWVGAVAGIAAGQVLGFAVALSASKDQVALALDHAKLRSMLAYGLPSLPAVAGATIQQAFGFLFLARYLNLNEVGVYAVGTRVVQIFVLFHTSFSLSWYPFILQSLSPEKRGAACRTGTALYFAIGIPLACLISMGAPELVRILAGPAYLSAIVIVPTLCLSEFLVGVVPIVNTGIIASKKTHLASLAYIASLVVTLTATFALAGQAGAFGAAAALTAGRIVHILSTEYYTRGIQQGLSEWPTVARGLLLALAAVVVSTFSLELFWPWRLLLAILVSALAIASLPLWHRARSASGQPT